MKLITPSRFAALAAMIALSACKTVPNKAPATPLELFNGTDLKEWRFVSADPQAKLEDTWTVRDGLLICKGAPVGFIHTARQFTNFQMVVEYRWGAGGQQTNSGIFSRITDVTRPLPRCAEVQLMHGSAGDVLGLQGMMLAEQQERFFEVKNHPLAGDIRGVKKIQDAEKPPGEWNRVEILAQGTDYTVWVNGQKVNSAAGIEEVPGYVGLQSEGGEIHFRLVFIKPLP